MQTDAILIKASGGDYDIISDGESRGILTDDEMIYISRSQDGIVVSIPGENAFIADSLEVKSSSDSCILNLRTVGGSSGYTEYKGSMAVSSGMGTLIIINNIPIEEYIAAVVQAEGGYNAHPEYFKTQAVITRTYAWLHMNKHGDEGYDLCDNVHCQVYHGRSIVEAIDKAVLATTGQVITDSDSLLVLTPFHSNCGGETAASDQVWLTAKPYLKSVVDPYCSFSRNAVWQKIIDKDLFVRYMVENGYDGLTEDLLSTFNQPVRARDFISGDFSLPLANIRSDLGLRSTLFSYSLEGDSLEFKGRGYGHGVGLCQEGAMVMATRGYTYKQIINFYYYNVSIIDIASVKAEVVEKESF
jgi:stage II sporulation protein D